MLLPIEVAILTAGVAAGVAGIHGFALAKAIADDTERRRLTAAGTLYRALHRLEEAGLVESWWEDPQLGEDEGRPRRRIYRVTPGGAVALTEVGRAETDERRLGIDPGWSTP